MLNVVSAQEAVKIILENTPFTEKTDIVSLEDALGRISGEDILSPEDLPAFARSTVDGYAVISQDTHGCSESIPAMLVCDGEIKMGELPTRPLENGHCIRIPTGGSLPSGSDAVSMIEYTDDMGDEFRYIYKPVSSLENVSSKGDDVPKGGIVLHKGDVIDSGNTAILAALGIRDLRVAARIRVGILSTGDELVEYHAKPQDSQIRNINSVMLRAQVKEAGADPVVYPIVRDELSLLTEALKNAVSECDIVLISGGSSVGDKDNTFKVLDNLGKVLFHGISIKPGKPTLFAMVDEKPVFGLPGHPQAAFFIFRLFVSVCLRKMTMTQISPVCTQRILSSNIPSNHGREEVIPVKITGQYVQPLYAKSGAVAVLSRAEGFIRIPREAEGLQKGACVDVFLL